jgi:selenocysteine lyase/cysteine desulfurase
MGGRPNVVLLPALVVGLEQVFERWGVARIGATLRPLTRLVARRAAEELGFDVPAEHADHIVGLYPAPHMPRAEVLEKRLAARGVVVAARWGALRVSPYVYNSAADVERLMALLGAASVASFQAALLTEIYRCNVCSCQEILRRHGRG